VPSNTAVFAVVPSSPYLIVGVIGVDTILLLPEIEIVVVN
jgi:hypothetical protein